MILISGATGKIGRELFRLLATSGEPVRVMARDPSKIDTVSGTVEVVQGDLNQEATLAPALQKVDKVFVLSPGPDIPAQDSAMIRAAQQAGIRHLVMLSSLGVEHDAGSGPAHRAEERQLRDSGLTWTVLRPNGFMSNLFQWRATIQSDGAIYLPTGDGRHAYIHPFDIAAVAAKVLTSAGHEGKIHELTGGEALSTADLAAKLGAELGKPLRHVDVPDAAYKDQLQRAGLPPFLIESITRFYTLIREGQLAYITPAVEQLVGRAPRRFDDWARENVGAFRSK